MLFHRLEDESCLPFLKRFLLTKSLKTPVYLAVDLEEKSNEIQTRITGHNFFIVVWGRGS